VSVLPDIDQRIAELEALDCGVLLEQLDLSAAIDGVRRNAAEYTGESETELDAEYQWLLIARWLRELRARRIAMGRDPGDERNATADLACPGCGDIMGECGCVQAAEEMAAFDEGRDEIAAAETLADLEVRGTCGVLIDDCPFTVATIESCADCDDMGPAY